MGDIEQAQESLSVGIGALAGSTIMLLTIPWGLSVIAGSVPIKTVDGKRKAIYKKGTKQLDGDRSKTGVAISEQIQKGSYIMILTTIPYFVIQVPAFFIEGNLAVGERHWALLGFIICICGFVGYLAINVKASQADEAKHHRTQVMITLLKKGQISLAGAFESVMDTYDTAESSSDTTAYEAIPGGDDDVPSKKVKEYLCDVLKSSFKKYDVDGDGELEFSEVSVKILFTLSLKSSVSDLCCALSLPHFLFDVRSRRFSEISMVRSQYYDYDKITERILYTYVLLCYNYRKRYR